MPFVFSVRFYALFAAGLVPLSLSWSIPVLRPIVAGYDIALILAACIDYLLSRKLPDEFTFRRYFSARFAIGAATEVHVVAENGSDRSFTLRAKDEYPPGMKLVGTRESFLRLGPQAWAEFTYSLMPSRRGSYLFGQTAVRFLSHAGLVWCRTSLGEPTSEKVYPNISRAREIELKALGARSFLAIQRRAVRRGEGREFESMRDYVIGDEMRHISWTATARRSRLTTRQYQIERDQTVIIAIDSGRLMTGRIGNETKFDTAIHASLALMSACSRAGDHCGLLVFGRRIRRYLPPKRGPEHIDAVLEALFDVEPELIEPSYARAFQFIASNSKKRAFVVVLTDLIDKESSKELINSIRLLRPRHLPMVVTVGDRDLNKMVGNAPADLKDFYTQSAAAEIIHQREQALRLVESLGGLALDVTTQTLGSKLLEGYLRVKERGLI